MFFKVSDIYRGYQIILGALAKYQNCNFQILDMTENIVFVSNDTFANYTIYEDSQIITKYGVLKQSL